MIKKPNTVKPTMNVFTKIAVSKYLLYCSLAGFPKLGKNKNKNKQKKKTENRKKLHQQIR